MPTDSTMPTTHTNSGTNQQTSTGTAPAPGSTGNRPNRRRRLMSINPDVAGFEQFVGDMDLIWFDQCKDLVPIPSDFKPEDFGLDFNQLIEGPLIDPIMPTDILEPTDIITDPFSVPLPVAG